MSKACQRSSVCGRPRRTSGPAAPRLCTHSSPSLSRFLVPSISSGPLPPHSCSPSTSQRSAASRLSGGAPTRPAASSFRWLTLNKVATPTTTTTTGKKRGGGGVGGAAGTDSGDGTFTSHVTQKVQGAAEPASGTSDQQLLAAMTAKQNPQLPHTHAHLSQVETQLRTND